MLVVESDTASDLWAEAWTEVSAHGMFRTHPRGDYLDSLHSILALRNPRQRWVASRRPGMNPAFAIAEVIWIVQGRNDSAFLLPWNRALPGFAGEGPTFYGAYGERLRSRFGFDQLRRSAEALRGSPAQRQVVLQIWDPASDFPTEAGKSRSRDVPCNVTAMLKVAEGRLEWLQVMRSNDVVRGLPYNLVQWTTLQEVLAGWLSLDVGSYVHVSDSLHIYDRDRNSFSTEEHQKAVSTVDLRRTEGESARVFSELERGAEMLAETTSASTAAEISESVTEPGYSDWIKVLAAERIRRLGDPQLAFGLVNQLVDDGLRATTESWHRERAERRSSR